MNENKTQVGAYGVYWPPTSNCSMTSNDSCSIVYQNNSSYLAVRRHRNLPHANLVIRITSEKSLTISRPSHGQTLWGTSLGRVTRHLRLEFLNHVLAFEIPNLDDWASGGAQPVAIGREAERVNCVSVIQGVQVLAIIEIPKHSFGILASGGAQGTIG